jgi:hypothetical protein
MTYLLNGSEAVFNTDQNQLAGRNGQIVKIVARIGTDKRVEEEMGVRYVIQFRDGLTAEVFDDRLTPTSTIRVVDREGNEKVLLVPPLPQWRQALELFDPDAHNSGLDGFDPWLYRWAVEWFVEWFSDEADPDLPDLNTPEGLDELTKAFRERYQSNYGRVDAYGPVDSSMVVEAMDLLKDQLDFVGVARTVAQIYTEHKGDNATQ